MDYAVLDRAKARGCYTRSMVVPVQPWPLFEAIVQKRKALSSSPILAIYSTYRIEGYKVAQYNLWFLKSIIRWPAKPFILCNHFLRH